MTSIFVYISSISGSYLFKSRLNLFKCLYSALLREKKSGDIYKYKQDINNMNRYEQICVRPYMLISLQFICTDMDYVVHICAYLCISVHICAYLCISNSTYIWLEEQQNWERMQLEGFVFTESRTSKGNSSVKQDWWHGQWAKSWPRSWCKRGGCQILARHPCRRYHIHSMLPSCSSWSRG